ncbi:MAG: putative Subtilisin, partial [Modestobacter sp.]|nr:putative Subtilisin [Modestobacter sp.]
MGPTTSSTSRRELAVRTGVVTLATALTVAAGAGIASAAPADQVGSQGAQQARAHLTGTQLEQVRSDLRARADGERPAGLPDTGPASFFIELARPATSQVYSHTLPAGPAAAAAAATAAKGQVEAAADQVIAQLPTAVPDATVLYSTTTVLSGVAVRADAADYESLTQLAGVTAVHPITPKVV